MSNAQSWAEDEVSDDEHFVNTPAELAQDNMLRKMEDRRSDPTPRERRDLGGNGGGSNGRGGRGEYDDRGGGGQGRGGRDRGGGGDRRAPRQQATEANIPMTGPFTAYVGNLPFATTAQALGEFFEGGECEVTDVVMAEDESGRSRGFGHVIFATRESLVKSLQADGVKLDNRAIKVDIDRKGQQEKGHAGFGDRDRGDRRYRDVPAGKSDAGGAWGRAAPRAAPQGANDGYQAASGGNKGGSRRGGDRPAGETETPPAPATRPLIKIAPRTKPLEEVAATSVASSAIFGEAKPRDATVFDRTVAAASEKPTRKERKNSEGGVAGENNRGKKEKDKDKDKKKEGDKESKSVDNTPIQRGQAVTATRKDGAANKDGKKKEQKPKAVTVPKPTDNLTDAERFELAQQGLARLSTAVRASDRTGPKPGNSFAGLMDSDSD